MAKVEAGGTLVLQVRKLFQQLFSFVNVQLFNQLLLRRECCSFSNGEYVKTGLAEVENWIHGAGKEWVGESWDELRYIRQVRARPRLAFSLQLLQRERAPPVPTSVQPQDSLCILMLQLCKHHLQTPGAQPNMRH